MLFAAVHESGPGALMRREAMSALAPLLGDERTHLGHCETDATDPLRDIEPLFDHAVGAAEQREGTVSPSAGCLEVDDKHAPRPKASMTSPSSGTTRR